MIERDAVVEMICSELAANDYYLNSGDSVGESEIRAVAGVDSFLASAKVRARAHLITTDYQ